MGHKESGLFDALSERLTGVFDRLSGRGVLSEKDGPTRKPGTPTVYRTFPVVRSLIWNPRNPEAVVKAKRASHPRR